MRLLENLDFLTEDTANQSNARLLSSMVENNNISHAYLFSGNDMGPLYGLAARFAASINCMKNGCGSCVICQNTLKGVYSNIMTVEPEGNFLRKEEVVEIQRFMNLSSYGPGKKICIIKEAELMNGPAANRLLKTLEEPPDEDSIFILLTEELSMVIPTIVSRCLVFNWNLRSSEDKLGKENFSNMEKYLDNGIKSIIDSSGKEKKIPLDLTLRLKEILKKMEAGFKTGQEKEIEDIRKSDFDREDINKYVKALKSKHKRRLNKLGKLGISKVFDIISAWLEDMLAVKMGAVKESLNYGKNYLFITKNIDKIDTDKIFNIIETIEGNRRYLDYSINTELALDNIFLQFQDIGQ
jgi:DNA polymerase-3 subunit delta'